jgi:hypothetical protein
MNALPRFRHEWVRLITLPFKVYVLSAYLITSLYLALIPRDYSLGDWVHLCFLGYVVSFSILVVAGLIQCLMSAPKDALLTWLIALTAPVCCVMMLPWFVT